MTLLSRYSTSNIVNLLDEIYRSDRYIPSPFSSYSRFIPVTDVMGKLEVELAGYSKNDIEVYTEKDILHVKATRGKDSTARTFHRTWSLLKEERVGFIKYENGLLTIEITKVVPEEDKRKYFKIE